MRNMANALGMTEITQRDDTMLFFVEQPSIEQVAKLSEKFKGRVMLNSLKRTNISLRLAGEDPLKIIREVLEVLSGNNFE